MEEELDYYKDAYVTAIGNIKMLKEYIRKKHQIQLLNQHPRILSLLRR